jgi:hypothetical protein
MFSRSLKSLLTFFLILILTACSSTLLNFQPSAPTAAPQEFYGMHIGNDTNVARAIPVLQDLGVRWTRLWVDVDWNQRNVHPAFQKARDLKAAGFKVIMVFNQAKVPAYSTVKDYFDWVQTLPDLSEAVDVWEILNELNLSRYWAGTADQYVKNVLKAAWDSLHPTGELVLGGSFTAYQRQNRYLGTEVTRDYIRAGYLNYIDYAGSHPYTKTVREMEEHLAALQKHYGSKPMILSEWNFKQQPQHQSWAAMLKEVRPFVSDRVVTACYYRLVGFDQEGGWPGIVEQSKSSYTPVEPFYSLYKSWPK